VLGSGRVAINRRRLICATVNLLSDSLIVYRSKQVMATINQLVRKPRAKKIEKAMFLRWRLVLSVGVYVLVFIRQHLKNQTPRYEKWLGLG